MPNERYWENPTHPYRWPVVRRWFDELNGATIDGQLVDGYAYPIAPDTRCEPQTDLAICIDGMNLDGGVDSRDSQFRARWRVFLENGYYFWSRFPQRDAARVLLLEGLHPHREVEVFTKNTLSVVATLGEMACRTVSDDGRVNTCSLPKALLRGVSADCYRRSGVYDPNLRFAGQYPRSVLSADLSARGMYWHPRHIGRREAIFAAYSFGEKPRNVAPGYMRIAMQLRAENARHVGRNRGKVHVFLPPVRETARFHDDLRRMAG